MGSPERRLPSCGVKGQTQGVSPNKQPPSCGGQHEEREQRLPSCKEAGAARGVRSQRGECCRDGEGRPGAQPAGICSWTSSQQGRWQGRRWMGARWAACWLGPPPQGRSRHGNPGSPAWGAPTCQCGPAQLAAFQPGSMHRTRKHLPPPPCPHQHPPPPLLLKQPDQHGGACLQQPIGCPSAARLPAHQQPFGRPQLAGGAFAASPGRPRT